MKKKEKQIDDGFRALLSKVIMELLIQRPFIGAITMKMKLVEWNEAPGCMATDGVQIFYDPVRLAKCTIPDLKFILLHEDMHYVQKAHIRVKEYLGMSYDNNNPDFTRIAYMYNIAQDLAINGVLIRDGWKTPSVESGITVCVAGRFPFDDFPFGLDTEAYFELLQQKEKQHQEEEKKKQEEEEKKRQEEEEKDEQENSDSDKSQDSDSDDDEQGEDGEGEDSEEDEEDGDEEGGADGSGDGGEDGDNEADNGSDSEEDSDGDGDGDESSDDDSDEGSSDSDGDSEDEGDEDGDEGEGQGVGGKSKKGRSRGKGNKGRGTAEGGGEDSDDSEGVEEKTGVTADGEPILEVSLAELFKNLEQYPADILPGPAEASEGEVDGTVAMSLAFGVGEHMDSFLRATITQEIVPSDIPWQQALRMYMTAKERSRPSYQRPNRRRVSGTLLFPSRMNNTLGDVALVMDTSGSMQHVFGPVANEMYSLVSAFPKSTFWAYMVDTRVRNILKYDRGSLPPKPSDWTFPGLGGTELLPGFVEAQKKNPSVIICCTDLIFGAFPPKPNCPVIWIVPKRIRTIHPRTVPYGNIIVMDDEKYYNEYHGVHGQ